MIKKIVSGGQTGVDQAALFVATQCGLSVGGWCPKGGLDENQQCILEKYPLREADTPDPNERTQRNIDDSDGTLILVPSWPLPKHIQDGTRLTYTYAKAQGKPYLIIALSDSDQHLHRIYEWIEHYNIRILNIGGPRESSSPGIYESSYIFLESLFMGFRPRPKL